MKIGILGCFYNCHENLENVLAPWFTLTPKYNFVFSAVSARFKEYKELDIDQNNTPTAAILNKLKEHNKIQYLNIPSDPLMESQARTLALTPLLDIGCDIIILLDGDEIYKPEEIENIIKYVGREDNSLYGWFSINFKNYIFDGTKWIDGFCPPRVFRTKINNKRMETCYWDNDFTYIEESNGDIKDRINYRDIANKPIPKPLAHVKHLTWMHSNGKQKIEYQKKHFGGVCSYRWNNETNQLELNEDYYLKTGQPLPIINQD